MSPTEIVTGDEGPLINAPDHLDFTPGTTRPPQLVRWRIPIAENYAISPPGHENQLQLTSSVLNLTGYDGNYAGPEGQTFISRRQVDTYFTFSVTLDYVALSAEGEEAGVSVFRVQNHHFDLGVVMLRTDNASESAEVSPHLRLRGESYLPVPEKVFTPVNETWWSQSLTMESRAFNDTHYSLPVGPRAHEYLWQTFGYAPAAALSFGFTGESF